MENSRYEGDQYFSQLDTIRNIENNLNQLKSRIQFLQKQENRTVQQIDKIFTSSIPILKSKIHQSHINAKINAIRNDSQQSKIQKAEGIRMSRVAQQNQISKNKMQINKTKAHQSFHIREMSKKNQKIIQDARRQFIEEKKKKSQLIKTFHIQSKRKIEQFHNQKQTQLKKIRKNERYQLDKKIQTISQSLMVAVRAEQQQAKKYLNQENMLKKLKKIVQILQGMKPQLLSQIMIQFGLSIQSLDDENNVEKVLLQIQRRKKYNSKQPQSNRMSMDRYERTQQKRNKSESMDVQQIYGNGYYKKMR